MTKIIKIKKDIEISPYMEAIKRYLEALAQNNPINPFLRRQKK
jgi:hypothetical protein